MTKQILTDAYFLYTSPQIALAAIYLIDSPLASFILDLKLPHAHQSALKSTVLTTVQSCADKLRTGGDPGLLISKEELDEAMRIDRKLWCCRNPEKVDLVGASKAAKRGISDATTIAALVLVMAAIVEPLKELMMALRGGSGRLKRGSWRGKRALERARNCSVV